MRVTLRLPQPGKEGGAGQTRVTLRLPWPGKEGGAGQTRVTLRLPQPGKEGGAGQVRVTQILGSQVTLKALGPEAKNFPGYLLSGTSRKT